MMESTEEVFSLEQRIELRQQRIDHWEPVVEISEGRTGRVGKVWEYYREGRTFAKPPVWDEEK